MRTSRATLVAVTITALAVKILRFIENASQAAGKRANMSLELVTFFP
jgi:hypothetical protein